MIDTATVAVYQDPVRVRTTLKVKVHRRSDVSPMFFRDPRPEPRRIEIGAELDRGLEEQQQQGNDCAETGLPAPAKELREEKIPAPLSALADTTVVLSPTGRLGMLRRNALVTRCRNRETWSQSVGLRATR